MGNDGKEKLDITDDELAKFKEAMKKEEFRKLLGEYAQELADPVKRAEYEAELVQLESQRGVDMKFIKPEPGYVIKGFCKKKQEKCFINVCTCAEIDQPVFTTSTQDGQTGQSCSLPYSLSPMHREKDNKDAECDVYDVVFHPEVLMRCQNPKFKEMVTDTALDAVINDLRVDMDKKEVKFPKMKFKGKAAESVIRKRVAAEDPDTFSHLPKRPDFPDLQGEEKKKETKCGKTTPAKPKKPSDEPEYRIVYRDNIDMGNFTNDRVAAVAPSHLIVYISLPKYNSAANVDLDVYTDQLELHSKDYNLVLDLPYGVDSDNGKAKFDKQKKELCITLETVKKSQSVPESDVTEPESTER